MKPHSELPNAMPAQNTIWYAPRERACTQEGTQSCTPTLKVDVVLVHAKPAASRNRISSDVERENASTANEEANTTVAPVVMASAEAIRRSLGNSAAPITAPAPRQPFNTPYPIAPWCRSCLATTARSAHAALANVVKANARRNTACNAGAWRKYRSPERIDPKMRSEGSALLNG